MFIFYPILSFNIYHGLQADEMINCHMFMKYTAYIFGLSFT